MSVTFPIVIRLAGEPEGKGRPRSRIVKKKGAGAPPPFVQTYTPEKTRKYEDQLRYAAQMAMGEHPPVEGPLFVTVTASMPVPASWPKNKHAAALAGDVWPTTKPDADNLLKTYDALNEVVWRDDKQAVVATVVKIYSARPELRIVVRRATRETVS